MLSKKDICELKALSNPPKLVATVFEPVMILLGKTTSWAEAKKSMSNPNAFLDALKNYSAENIQPSVVQHIQKVYFSNPEFNFEDVKRKSCAASNMVAWTIAMVNIADAYHRQKGNKF